MSRLIHCLIHFLEKAALWSGWVTIPGGMDQLVDQFDPQPQGACSLAAMVRRGRWVWVQTPGAGLRLHISHVMELHVVTGSQGAWHAFSRSPGTPFSLLPWQTAVQPCASPDAELSQPCWRRWPAPVTELQTASLQGSRCCLKPRTHKRKESLSCQKPSH